MNRIEVMKKEVERIRKAHASARPKSVNPAWQNTHHGLGVVLEYITAIEAAEKQEQTTVDDNSQDWAGMDGATAWHLIHRHADGWGDVGKMMDEWRKANTTSPAGESK